MITYILLKDTIISPIYTTGERGFTRPLNQHLALDENNRIILQLYNAAPASNESFYKFNLPRHGCVGFLYPIDQLLRIQY